MCGRFNLRTNPAAFVAAFDAAPPAGSGQLLLRYNIAPTQTILAVRQTGSVREAVPLRWGLIPSWSKDAKIGARLINARADTAPDKPSFRSAFKRRRCLVPASGFYEWQGQAGAKQPYHIFPSRGGLMAFAGLWERWQPPGGDGDAVESCTILTTEANETLRDLHDRMPVILAPTDYRA